MTTPRADDLARHAAFVAADLERRSYPLAGVVRRAARALLELEPADAGGCRGCGGPLPKQTTGRPRLWCSESCRRAHRP